LSRQPRSWPPSPATVTAQPTSKWPGHSVGASDAVTAGSVATNVSMASTPKPNHPPSTRAAASSMPSGASGSPTSGVSLPTAKGRSRSTPASSAAAASVVSGARLATPARSVTRWAPLVRTTSMSSPNAGVAMPPGAGWRPNRPV
jgi:hypothetical protein